LFTPNTDWGIPVAMARILSSTHGYPEINTWYLDAGWSQHTLHITTGLNILTRNVEMHCSVHRKRFAGRGCVFIAGLRSCE
jgi:hypothetical protein